MATGLRIKGLAELHHALQASDELLLTGLRVELHQAGELVAGDVRPRLLEYSSRTAAGVGVDVSKSRSYAGSVFVLQKNRKSRIQARRRGNYGSLQMRHGFLPALRANEEAVNRQIEQLLDRLGREW